MTLEGVRTAAAQRQVPSTPAAAQDPRTRGLVPRSAAGMRGVPSLAPEASSTVPMMPSVVASVHDEESIFE
jgi:hypothetical protein